MVIGEGAGRGGFGRGGGHRNGNSGGGHGGRGRSDATHPAPTHGHRPASSGRAQALRAAGGRRQGVRVRPSASRLTPWRKAPRSAPHGWSARPALSAMHCCPCCSRATRTRRCMCSCAVRCRACPRIRSSRATSSISPRCLMTCRQPTTSTSRRHDDQGCRFAVRVSQGGFRICGGCRARCPRPGRSPSRGRLGARRGCGVAGVLQPRQGRDADRGGAARLRDARDRAAVALDRGPRGARPAGPMPARSGRRDCSDP